MEQDEQIAIQPVILCGGSGTRLWPLSRQGFPKQFLALTAAETLFQQSLQRAVGLEGGDIQRLPPCIVSNEAHRFLVLEQAREIQVGLGPVILEPCAKNTAPALTLAALSAMNSSQDPVLVVTPSDHVIADQQLFTDAMLQAVREAAAGAITILGITPDRPETGYGYIRAPKPAGDGDKVIRDVQAFVEKPDAETARRYLEEGGYYWNAGMFVLKASVWLAALERFRPDIAEASRAAWAANTADSPFTRPDKDAFSAIPGESIDYAVMEKCPNSGIPIRMIPLDAGWSDLGAWDAVWELLPKDAAGNAHHGDVLINDSKNTLVHAGSRLVSLVGVSDLVVIETPDAVLVADKSRSQHVKEIVNALNKEQRGEHDLHRKVHRPWGWYDCIDECSRFKVKRIQVNPGASISLQKHLHRAEHWVVVKGTAEITRGEEIILLTENQSTFIPLGQIHRLTNPGTIPLEIIEVQSGSYLGEDDIVRFDDSYGRS